LLAADVALCSQNRKPVIKMAFSERRPLDFIVHDIMLYISNIIVNIQNG
jgi:hypothetical protein